MTAGDDGPSGVIEWLRWFRETDRTAVVYVREALSSVLVVVVIGAILFAISGIWPPMVAVESASMEPNMARGDLVFVMEEHRLSPDRSYGTTGVVTHRIGQATGYTRFNRPGDVIVYRRDGASGETPIIHRAMFWVNDSENWYEKANPDAVGGADNCQQLRQCPAPHEGFITKGDNNDTNPDYDQVTGLSEPVRPTWVVGTAEFSIPWLGNIRLWASGGILMPAEPVMGQPGAHSGIVTTPGADDTLNTGANTIRYDPAYPRIETKTDSFIEHKRNRPTGSGTHGSPLGPGVTA